MRPRDLTFQCAISHEDEKSAFLSTPGISLINEAQKPLTSALDQECLIDARSINSILDESGREGRIDYLNIDVEGAEMSALEGLDFEKWKPRVVSVEIHEKSLESGLAHPVALFLAGRGYVCLACAAITYIFVHEDQLG